MTGFFVQELILSSLYVWRARDFLHSCHRRKDKNSQVQRKLRAMMIHLILTNLVLISRTYLAVPSIYEIHLFVPRPLLKKSPYSSPPPPFHQFYFLFLYFHQSLKSPTKSKAHPDKLTRPLAHPPQSR